MHLPTLDVTALAAALRDDAVGAIAISVAICGLFAGAELVKRARGVPTEWTRKGTHVGAGVVVMAFPWLLAHTATVVLLALAFFGILAGGRVTGLLGSIHDVERRTGGAYYYPFAVLLAWVLSRGDALLFCLPLAVMAVADTGAALVGQRAGETTFRVMDGERSVEGSLAFFTLAFALVLAGCAIAGRPGWPELLLVTLVVAGLTTAVEAVSVRGSDNILIPYAAWMALESTLRLGLEGLGDWILGMGLGVAVLFTSTSRARLSAAGGVTVFLVCTLSWALGGLAWFLPLLVLWALYLLARPPALDTDLDMVFPTTAGAMAVLLLFAHTADPTLYGPYLVSLAASGAIAAWQVAGARGWSAWILVPAASILPGLVSAIGRSDVPFVAVAIGGVAGLGLFQGLSRTPIVGRRLAASLTCGLAAWWMLA